LTGFEFPISCFLFLIPPTVPTLPSARMQASIQLGGLMDTALKERIVALEERLNVFGRYL
jgi:hypothetical protein